jgi:uncharacterized protein (TIGR03437 family)
MHGMHGTTLQQRFPPLPNGSLKETRSVVGERGSTERHATKRIWESGGFEPTRNLVMTLAGFPLKVTVFVFGQRRFGISMKGRLSMKSVAALCLFGTGFVSSLLALEPRISGVTNHYSHIPSGLPNYGIAPGAIFDIFGSNLAQIENEQTTPLQPTLAGVTVNVTIEDLILHPLLCSAGPTEIKAILPPNTPVGVGNITVTNNGLTSAAARITVVRQAFGIMTVNRTGTGAAEAFDSRAIKLSFTNAASPGDTIMLWGTGLGAAAGDGITPSASQDLSSIPIDVEIGGVPAPVVYSGDSRYPGVDQISVMVPDSVQGCYVSVVVKTGNIVSNVATIPIAVGQPGQPVCSDPLVWLTSDELATLAGHDSLTIGQISLTKNSVRASGMFGLPPVGLTIQTAEGADATFVEYTPDQLFAMSNGQVASIGSCTVYTFKFTDQYSDLVDRTYIDAGQNINITGPHNSIKLAANDIGRYSYTSAIPGGANESSLIQDGGGGTFQADNGAAGGNEVGTFVTQGTLGTPLEWSNAQSIRNITTSRGLTVIWTGGNPNDYVRISGRSTSRDDDDVPTGAVFTCTAPIAAHAFAIPQTVLLALPPSRSGGFPPSTLSVSEITAPKRFAARGLDIGLFSVSVATTMMVAYNVQPPQ